MLSCKRTIFAIWLPFVAMVVLISMTKISDYDFWWHLGLGKTIFASFNISPTDSFSYTFAGFDQFNNEWLSDLLLYLTFDLGGYWAVNLLKAFILIATFILLSRPVLSGGSEERYRIYAIVVTLAVLLFSLRFRIFPRPFLFSYLFLSACLFILARHSQTGKGRILYVLPLIVLVWANASKGVFLVVPVSLFYLIAAWREGKLGRDLLQSFALVIMATLAAPEGVSLYSYLFERIFTASGTVLGENAPLTTDMLWGYGWRYTLPYQVLVLGSLVYFVCLRGWRNLFHLLLFTFFFAASVAQVRMIDFFSIVAVPFFFVPAASLCKKMLQVDGARPWLTDAMVGTGLVVVALAAVLGSDTYVLGVGPKESSVPEGAISFLEREGVTGKLFNSYPYGGYVIWRSPDRRVFIDGRNDHLYSQEFYDDYYRALHSAEDWAAAERRWKFDYALLEYDYRTMGRHFPRHLADNPDWALVYWGEHSLVYLKRTEEHAKIIERNEFKIFKPSFYDFKYLGDNIEGWVGSLAAVDEEVARASENQELRLAKVYLLYRRNSLIYRDEIMKELKRCLEMAPDLAMEHSALARMLFNQGRLEEARQQVLTALELDPSDKGAAYLKGKLGI